MTLNELIVKDDNYISLNEARRELLEYISTALASADDFPQAKHTPEAFFALYKQTQSGVIHQGLSVDDVKRAFALYLLSLDEDTVAINDDWVLYDELTFFMKELWF